MSFTQTRTTAGRGLAQETSVKFLNILVEACNGEGLTVISVQRDRRLQVKQGHGVRVSKVRRVLVCAEYPARKSDVDVDARSAEKRDMRR